MEIYKRNRTVYYVIRFCSNLLFTIPIWIAYYKLWITDGQLSLLVAIQHTLQMIVEIPSGAIADLLGRKNTISLGLFFGIVSSIIILFATNFWHFFLSFACAGIMDSLISGAEEALQYDSLKQDNVQKSFKEVFSKAYILLQTAIMIGTLAGGFMYKVYPLLPFILHLLAVIVAFIASRFYIEPTIDSYKFSIKTYAMQLQEGIKAVFKTRELALVSLFFIVVGGITWASQSYFNTNFLTVIVQDDSIRGVIQSSIRFINILLIQFVFSKNFIKTTNQKMLFFFVIIVVAYLPGVFINGTLGIGFIYLATLASTIRYLYAAEIINPLVESKHRATAISTMSMGVSLINIVLYYLSAYLIPKYGIGAMYSLLGVISFFTLAPLLIRKWKIDTK